MDEHYVHLLPGLPPKSSKGILEIARGILDAALEGEMTYISVEYVVDGKMNNYSVKVG